MSALRLRYQTLEVGAFDVHLRTLRDNQQFSDLEGVAEKLGISSANWPMFGIVWPSAQVLAHHMLDFEVAGKRILEVGCGIALASLVLNYRRTDITATDHHPETESFLRRNSALNDGPVIPFDRTGWADLDDELGAFDLIIGSDLLYEPDHARLLASFIDAHAKQQCEVIIVDPGRKNEGRFSKLMLALGYGHSKNKPVDTSYLEAPFKGHIHSYVRGVNSNQLSAPFP